MNESKDFDELWEITKGTPVCPNCDSPLVCGHITAVNIDLALVNWICENCGHKWSNCCPFEDGVLTTPFEYSGT